MKGQSGNMKHTHSVLEKGTMVSHYRLIEKIGAGGMGEVYLAEDSKLNRKVALKFLSDNQADNSSLRRHFTKEAQAAARLQHPNIIIVHEVNEYKGMPYIAMAYIEGHSLNELPDSKILPIKDIINIGMQICSGLAVAHESGITHRDLKPGNIMVDQSGTIKILDFGLAIISDSVASHDVDSTVTSNPFTGKIAGTISYMAPEQLIGQEISPLVDIFAFGVIMYELITSEHPFAADSISEISAKILRDTPTEITNKRSNIPYDLNRIISRCLHKIPTKRFQTARDICNELGELLNKLNSDIDASTGNQGIEKLEVTLTEESFVLTTELVRTLSTKDPKMIGTRIAYLDNQILSDELIFYLHGLGNDQRQFFEVLLELPYRAVAFSLYGFDYNAQYRAPIILQDHSILMHAMLKDLCSRLKPRKVIMVGFSSGADHILNCLTSELFDDIKVKGVLSLGCNIHLEDCFATSRFAELTSGDENQILSIIKSFGNNTSSISDWLILHNYLATAFCKFKDQTEPLRQYAADILKPFMNDSWAQFPKWYKSCVKKIPYVRFIIDTGGYSTLDGIMRRHLEENILGDNFHENTIVRDTSSHMELVKTEIVCKHTLDFMKLINTK